MFPGVQAPIRAGRPETLRAIQAAVDSGEKLVFAVAQRENVEQATAENLFTIGTIARVGHVQKGRGGVQLLLEGSNRGIAFRISRKTDHLEAIVRAADEMSPADPKDPAFQGLFRELRDRARELGQHAGFPEEMVAGALANVEGPGQLADLVASYLDISHQEQQALLETLSVEERLRRVLVHVQRQISVHEAQEDIQSKVQQELGDRQREMVLREQLKAIQKELGESDEGEELDELREQLEGLDLPPEARKEIDRELNRLGRMNRESMEYQVVRSYLETISELPWNDRTDEHLDLHRASEILNEDHYGLQEVKDRVLEFLAVHTLRQRALEEAALEAGSDTEKGSVDGEPDEIADSGAAPEGHSEDRVPHGPILLFVGPPGVGKTSIAKSIARSMGRKYVRISLGGARDEADIRGHRRTYVGAMPGRVIKGMKQAGSKNPVFLLDEVDKVGASYQGDPAAALLEVLDPAQNDSFVDHYIGVPFDLSEVLFIATANFIENIPGPLRDRMEVVDFTGYTEKEKLEIARRYLVPRQMREKAVDSGAFAISDEAIAAVITHYTREAGVRQLERQIGKLCRKVARKVADGEQRVEDLTPGEVRELLILFVEVTTMPGKGELVLTGQLGDVMKESARAAWSYARSRSAELGIKPSEFEQDVHVHVPAGAIPKDGPSAGVTMATALVSALSGVPIRHDLAMTGEITLSGRVLTIGGVKEKVLGAVRSGIGEIVLPKENEADLEDIPEEVRAGLHIHAVERLDEVLAIALPGLSPLVGRGPGMAAAGGERPLEH
jgi:ATP-dependent Lon protease